MTNLRDSRTGDKYGALQTAAEERERLVAAFRREDALQTEVCDLEDERDRYRAALQALRTVYLDDNNTDSMARWWAERIIKEALDGIA